MRFNHDLTVVGFNGGNYESAKTDKRREFNRILNLIQMHKEKVSFILVYRLDRLSRTGGNAIFISSELKRSGVPFCRSRSKLIQIAILANFHESINFIFSEYDNDLLREKCIVGMKEKLSRDEWIGVVPMGYSKGDRRGKRIEFDENAMLVERIFLLKA